MHSYSSSSVCNDGIEVDANNLSILFYRMGTSELQSVYADSAKDVTLPNPVGPESTGEWPSIFLDVSKMYRVVLQDGHGTTLIEADPYLPGVVDGLVAEFQTAGFLNTARAIAMPFADVASALDVLADGAYFSVITGCHRAVYRKNDCKAELLYSCPVPAELASWVMDAAGGKSSGTAGVETKSFLSAPVFTVILDAPANGMVDAGPDIQELHDTIAAEIAAGDYPTVIVQVPQGVYLIDSPVVIDKCAMLFVGTGFNVGPDIKSGTWFKVTDPNITPFTFKRLQVSPDVYDYPVRGSGFSNVAFFQEHNEDLSGTWSPTNYPHIIKCDNMLGEFFIENVYALRCNQFLNSVSSGRLRVNGLYGQFFKNIVTIDDSQDVPHIVGVHAWTYWSNHNKIMSYQQESTDFFIFGRVDTPFVDRIFCLGGRSLFHFKTGSGSTSKFTAGSIVADFCQYGLWIESNGFTGDIAALNSQHESVTDHGVPLAGAYSVYAPANSDSGNGPRFSIAGHHVQAVPGAAIKVEKANGVVDIGRAYYERLNQSGGSGATDVVTGSVVRFAIPPTIDNSGSCPLVSTGSAAAEQSIMQKVPAQAVNYLQASAAIAGAPASLQPIGTDTDIGVDVATKGGGLVRLRANGNTVARFGHIANGDTSLLVRKGVSYVEIKAEGATNGDMVISPTGAGCVWIPNGGWNTQHLRLGAYHMWVDTSGKLRIKNSAPTSSTDGAVVGTQS
ncbi:hypothetical protein Q4610_04085 [Sphingobium sp. HBC34]|uniref:Pectate lyase superfamily protein domain-containing protein n=1 Tax=Sphingobium cyanobacteriorum TaxID=3063954 RepID=A0ABT8ZJ92_9SPHN|nr:hypothetical protein [Sphingobium sp. HBC34]MDO7834218.1 hypothetical protein [Sphingobium sp. HBC34]